MNTTIQPFNFEDHQVRTATIEGEPWFSLPDVCKVLEIKDSAVAARRLESSDVTRVSTPIMQVNGESANRSIGSSDVCHAQGVPIGVG